MDKKKLSIRLTYLIFLILFLNVLAHRFYWYSSIWYFDMVMHFLGGLWLGLALVWIFPPKEFSYGLFVRLILGVFCIGVAWEVFEIVVHIFTDQMPFNILDTFSDICFDLAGGIFSFLYFFKRILFAEKI